MGFLVSLIKEPKNGKMEAQGQLYLNEKGKSSEQTSFNAHDLPKGVEWRRKGEKLCFMSDWHGGPPPGRK